MHLLSGEGNGALVSFEALVESLGEPGVTTLNSTPGTGLKIIPAESPLPAAQALGPCERARVVRRCCMDSVLHQAFAG